MKEFYIWIGDTWAGTLYDLQRGERDSPRLQRQKQSYTEQMGKTTIACLTLYLLPVAHALLQRIFDALRPPGTPDTLYFDLQYTIPFPSYGPYGTFIILTGSLLLSSNLFDNFLSEGLKEGQGLALAHSGIMYLFIGSLFQVVPLVDITSNLSPPGPPFNTPYTFWTFIQKFKYTLPLFPLLFILLLWAFGGKLERILEDTTQTRLDSVRWDDYKRTGPSSRRLRPPIQTRLDSERWNRHIQTRLNSDRWKD